jgi:penicillin-binding protein 2
MYKRIPVKNHYQEIQLTASRSLLAMIVIALLILLLIIRLAWLQLYKQNVYATLATNNWMDLVPAEPTRGLIYDRNGVLLAENIPVFSLDIIPYEVKNLDTVLADIGKIIELNDNDLSQFKKQLKQHRRFDEIPLKLRMSEEEVMRFAENQHRFPGVTVNARLMRHYPFGESFSHVIGYVGRINTQELGEIDTTNYSASHYIGKLGIEKYYEQPLHGKVGYQQVENDASGKSIRILKEIKGTPGENVYLTLDSGLQFVAETALKGHRGAIVAIDPANGEVLALVSQPSYDPNQFVIGISTQDFQVLQESPDRPLYNRALRGLYPPGSTIKPFLALQGLETGTITEDTQISDPGWFEIPNSSHRYHDSKPGGHGTVNLNTAILSSCDIYFYKLAERMGIHNMAKMLNQFGYGKLTEIDLDHELPGVLASPEWKRAAKKASWYPGDTINSSIGQGYMQVTPLQLATATATLANHGTHITPHLLLGAQTPGDLYKPYQSNTEIAVALRDEQNWERVIRGMQEVVSSPHGTARRYGKAHTYTVAAKTGTAQVVAKRNQDGKDNQDSWPERFRDHHLFIAFAPVDHPKIAIAVITENSNIAIETARALLDYYLGSKSDADRPPEAEIQKTST